MIENDYNPADLYPANFAYWKDFEILSLYDLVLLSLGIEPSLILELYHLRDESDADEKLHFGTKQAEFDRRLSVMNNIAAAGDIKVISSGKGMSPIKQYRVKDFINWAISAGWHLPEEFLAFLPSTSTTAITNTTSSGQSRREIKKAETQLMYTSWQNKADELWAINSKLDVINVANKISVDKTLPTPYKRSAHTIRKHIKEPPTQS